MGFSADVRARKVRLCLLPVLLVISSRHAVAVDPDPRKETDAPRSKEPIALLRGHVSDRNGKPLPDARVRIAIPTADMRFVDHTTKHTLYEVTTGQNGEYRVRIPGLPGRTRVSIDAMLPGYRRLSGTLMQERSTTQVDVVPNAIREASLELVPAMYFAGVVVDEDGQPISDVEITADANSPVSSGGVERTRSNRDGLFELFNYSADGFNPGGDRRKGTVSFSHPDYLIKRIDDVYSIEEDQQYNMRIVLDSGHKISGLVLTDAGKPAEQVLVVLHQRGRKLRKAAITNQDGKFTLKGLVAGPTEITARAFKIDQKCQTTIELNADQSDFELRMQEITLPKDLKRYSVLGMQLADVTPEIASAYDLLDPDGVLILDPGTDSDRLKIGTLTKGYCLWGVGQTNVCNIKEFIEQILANTGDQTEDTYWIKVVYSFSNVESDGTNSQYLELRSDDIIELKHVLSDLNRK